VPCVLVKCHPTISLLAYSIQVVMPFNKPVLVGERVCLAAWGAAVGAGAGAARQMHAPSGPVHGPRPTDSLGGRGGYLVWLRHVWPSAGRGPTQRMAYSADITCSNLTAVRAIGSCHVAARRKPVAAPGPAPVSRCAARPATWPRRWSQPCSSCSSSVCQGCWCWHRHRCWLFCVLCCSLL
jgi:hypothetical protein